MHTHSVITGSEQAGTRGPTLTMGPGVRKLALTAHLTSSVGWLGAVAAFLALAVVGLTGGDAELVRASYVAMKPIAWYVIVPLALASLATGILQSLATPWGLFQHYWVVAKLLLTLVITLLLFLHLQVIEVAAADALEATLSGAERQGVRFQLIGDAGGALLALLVITGLGVFKPRGLTPYGRRRQSEAAEPAVVPAWVKASGVGLVLLLVLLRAVKHLHGGHMGGHF